ncbi:LacI family DNA-binding transcriptional regulator [Microlunatus sp. Y2014]|uniref:LacI family DNA-binding transcriptional regulator n=1 Tax=Microlunatus sp. Y2014 TaxID=3418488 RepID=UPI003DA74B4B
MAEAAGVSTATVTNVLAGRVKRVSAQTSARVMEVAERLGYHPNPAARAVRTGRTNLVLLSLTVWADPWATDLAGYIGEEIRHDGLHSLVLPDGDWSRVLDEQATDLTFIDAVEPRQADRLQSLARRGLRLVVYDEELSANGFDVISSPALPGCRLAMDHLLADHTRIGCLAGHGGNGPSSRVALYREAMAEAGLEVTDDLIEEFVLDPTSPWSAAVRLLSRDNPPTAVFATTDFAAMCAVRVAERLKLRVPEDVAVIGVGNTRRAATMSPSVSSVGPVDLLPGLADLIRGRALGTDTRPPQVHDYPWQLHVRGSSAVS